ncbi:MAG: hypothetical protein AAF203_11230, partial [Pseudomonadota bacterium]
MKAKIILMSIIFFSVGTTIRFYKSLDDGKVITSNKKSTPISPSETIVVDSPDGIEDVSDRLEASVIEKKRKSVIAISLNGGRDPISDEVDTIEQEDMNSFEDDFISEDRQKLTLLKVWTGSDNY